MFARRFAGAVLSVSLSLAFLLPTSALAHRSTEHNVLSAGISYDRGAVAGRCSSDVGVTEAIRMLAARLDVGVRPVAPAISGRAQAAFAATLHDRQSATTSPQRRAHVGGERKDPPA